MGSCLGHEIAQYGITSEDNRKKVDDREKAQCTTSPFDVWCHTARASCRVKPSLESVPASSRFHASMPASFNASGVNGSIRIVLSRLLPAISPASFSPKRVWCARSLRQGVGYYFKSLS